jgi:hypothetical protein
MWISGIYGIQITNEWLNEHGACEDGRKWFEAQTETDGAKVVETLIGENKLEWANWTICRLFDRRQRIQYAIFAAEQVLGIFEKRYPGNKRPRRAIAAAKAVIENDTEENRAAASDAARAAWAAASDAARAASDAAWAAASDAASDAAWAASDAASDASDAASDAWAAASDAMQKTILDYGLTLIRDLGGQAQMILDAKRREGK